MPLAGCGCLCARPFACGTRKAWRGAALKQITVVRVRLDAVRGAAVGLVMQHEHRAALHDWVAAQRACGIPWLWVDRRAPPNGRDAPGQVGHHGCRRRWRARHDGSWAEWPGAAAFKSVFEPRRVEQGYSRCRREGVVDDEKVDGTHKLRSFILACILASRRERKNRKVTSVARRNSRTPPSVARHRAAARSRASIHASMRACARRPRAVFACGPKWPTPCTPPGKSSSST